MSAAALYADFSAWVRDLERNFHLERGQEVRLELGEQMDVETWAIELESDADTIAGTWDTGVDGLMYARDQAEVLQMVLEDMGYEVRTSPWEEDEDEDSDLSG